MTDLVVMLAGASNATEMGHHQVAGMTPAAGTYIWQPNTAWRSIAASDGAGIIELANMLKAQTGRDVYIIVAAYGGSSCTPEATNPAARLKPRIRPTLTTVGSQGRATARAPAA